MRQCALLCSMRQRRAAVPGAASRVEYRPAAGEHALCQTVHACLTHCASQTTGGDATNNTISSHLRIILLTMAGNVLFTCMVGMGSKMRCRRARANPTSAGTPDLKTALQRA